MYSVIRRVTERKKFLEATFRDREKEKKATDEAGLPPIFNKRMFAAGSVVVTAKAREVFVENSRHLTNHHLHLSPSEISAVQDIVDALRFIHHGINYAKTCLAHCLTFEQHEAHHYIQPHPHEEFMSCFFILCGTVEATYDWSNANARQVFEPNIIYTHTMGEYISLVTPNEDESDMAPPSTIYTKELTQMLRIDRQKFHALIANVRQEDSIEKIDFLADPKCVLNALTEQEKSELLPKLIRDVFKPNQILIQQGKPCEWVYFVAQGRCQVIRIIRAIGNRVVDLAFNLWIVDEGEMFGYEKNSEDAISPISVLAKSSGHLYKLHIRELEASSRQHLIQILKSNGRSCPDDRELLQECSVETTWKAYRKERLSSLVQDRKEDLRCIQRSSSAPHLSAIQKRYFKFIQSMPPSDLTSSRRGLSRPAIPELRILQDMTENLERQDENDPADMFSPNHCMNIWKQSSARQPRRDSGLLANVVGHIVKRRVRTFDSSEIDSRELIRKFQSKENVNNKLRQGWIYAMEAYDEDLRNPETVAEINTQQLIDSAREDAEKQARKVIRLKYKRRNDSPWTSAVEEEQASVRERLAFGRYRSQFLKQRLNRLKKNPVESKDDDEEQSDDDSSSTATDDSQDIESGKSTRRIDNMSKEEVKEIIKQRRLRMMKERQGARKGSSRMTNATPSNDSGSSSRNSLTSPHREHGSSHSGEMSDGPPMILRRSHLSVVSEERQNVIAQKAWALSRVTTRLIGLYHRRRKS